MRKRSVVILISILILIIVIPIVFLDNSKFEGTDTVAEKLISETNTDYKPWTSSIFTPPSGEMESLIFAIQAAIGAGVIGYGIGYMSGIHKKQKKSKEHHEKNNEIK